MSRQNVSRSSTTSMFFKVYLVASTLIAITMAQATNQTCYQGGPTAAGPSTDCSQFVNTFCDSAASATMCTHDSIGRCFNLPNNNTCDFIAWNTFTRNVSPPAADCKSVLNNVISNCSLGGFGQTSAEAYTFTVDVNHGQCGRDVRAGS